MPRRGEKLSLFVDKKLLMPLQLWATVFFVRVIICFLTMTQENLYIIFLYMYIIVLTVAMKLAVACSIPVTDIYLYDEYFVLESWMFVFLLV